MANKVQDRHEEQGTKPQCIHYWIIEPANGPTSKGVCKYCGEAKEFQNYWSGSFWGDNVSTLYELPSLPDIELDERQDDS